MKRGGCTCRPADGFHQYGCSVSRRMRAELIEAGRPRPRVDRSKRAEVAQGSTDLVEHLRGEGYVVLTPWRAGLLTMATLVFGSLWGSGLMLWLVTS